MPPTAVSSLQAIGLGKRDIAVSTQSTSVLSRQHGRSCVFSLRSWQLRSCLVGAYLDLPTRRGVPVPQYATRTSLDKHSSARQLLRFRRFFWKPPRYDKEVK